MAPSPTLRRVLSDDALARRAAAGDDQAFAALFDRHHARMVGYCRSILRHDADADDAAQAAMAKAHAALPRRDRDDAVRSWLFRIAHNEAISLMRRRRPADELHERLAAPRGAPDEAAELREEVALLLDGVRDLPDRARHALLLREVAGLDHAGVGDVLGVTPGAARQAVFEARTALQAERAGRLADCGTVRAELERCGLRRRPTRQARGHLRGCAACQDWSRRSRLRSPVVAVPAAGGVWAWLTGLLGVGAEVKTVATMAAIATGAGIVPVVEPKVREAAAPVVAAEAEAKASPATPAPEPSAATAARAAANGAAAPAAAAPSAEGTSLRVASAGRGEAGRRLASRDRGTTSSRPASRDREAVTWRDGSSSRPAGRDGATSGSTGSWSRPVTREDAAPRPAADGQSTPPADAREAWRPDGGTTSGTWDGARTAPRQGVTTTSPQTTAAQPLEEHGQWTPRRPMDG